MSNITFTLTFTQCKQVVASGADLRDTVESLNNQPNWLVDMGAIEDFNELKSIIEGGCASGAYMPAVTYHTANRVMAEHGDDVLEFIDDQIGLDQLSISVNDSWSGLAVKFLSAAVELWCGQFSDVADHIDWE